MGRQRGLTAEQEALWEMVEPLLLARGRYPATLAATTARIAALQAAEATLRAAGEILLARAVNLALGEAQHHHYGLRKRAADEEQRQAETVDRMRGELSAGGQAFLDLDGGISDLTLEAWLEHVEAWAMGRC